jgi:hypothetical protein
LNLLNDRALVRLPTARLMACVARIITNFRGSNVLWLIEFKPDQIKRESKYALSKALVLRCLTLVEWVIHFA